MEGDAGVWPAKSSEAKVSLRHYAKKDPAGAATDRPGHCIDFVQTPGRGTYRRLSRFSRLSMGRATRPVRAMALMR